MLKIIRNQLARIISDIDCGNSNLSENECIELMKHLNTFTNWNNKISKYEACQILGVSRATFDNYVRAGKLPKGQRQIGFKEIYWERKEIEDFKLALSEKK